jgi:hypothetical protein
LARGGNFGSIIPLAGTISGTTLPFDAPEGDIDQKEVFKFLIITKVRAGRLGLPAQVLGNVIVSRLVGVGPCWWMIGQA